MSETQSFLPRESTTGLRDTPCLVFGNGVEIETVVYAKTTQENSRQTSEGRTILNLPQRIGKNLPGIDIVKVHFLPKTSLSDRVNDPLLIPEEEKNKIGKDCLEGFMSLAASLKNNEVQIRDHVDGDYYLFADTNPQFAAFLRQRCGFRGMIKGSQAWIKKSEFISEENIKHMSESYDFINNLITRQK